MSLYRSTGERLRGLAADLESVAHEFDIPSRSTHRSDALIARVETIVADVRAVVRGGTGPVRH